MNYAQVRKLMQFNVASRKMVDRTSTCVRHLKDRIFRPEARSSAKDVSCAGGASSWDMLPPAACLSNASSSVCARFVHSSFCKDRCPVNAVCWTPEGRRLLRSICEARAASEVDAQLRRACAMWQHGSRQRAVVGMRARDMRASATCDGEGAGPGWGGSTVHIGAISKKNKKCIIFTCGRRGCATAGPPTA